MTGAPHMGQHPDPRARSLGPLRKAVTDLEQELSEARAREAATSEILRVINRSPTDYQPVFQAILENARRLCDAPLAMLLIRRDDAFHLVAHSGTRPEFVEFMLANPLPLEPEKSVTAKAVAEHRPIEVLDTADERSLGAGSPSAVSGSRSRGSGPSCMCPCCAATKPSG